LTFLLQSVLQSVVKALFDISSVRFEDKREDFRYDC
jgi:hypothetical protein